MIKWIVFDLDDTLLDTSKILIPIALTPLYWERVRKPLPLLEGAWENLEWLVHKYSLALLTMGDPHLQQQKLTSMKIASYFKELYFADTSIKETKKKYFSQLTSKYSLLKNEFLSIGNRLETDIKEAQQVGGSTCWFRYGEHSQTDLFLNETQPDYTITHHRDLISTCKL